MKVIKDLFLFLIGGGLYCMIEFLFRGYSHISMLIVGGLCFLICGCLNEFVEWDAPLVWQALIGCAAITGVEFAAGVILNLWLGLGIWDYSNMPFNVMGQICLPFMVAWYFIAIVAIVLDDYLRYWIFGEEEPHYTIWRKKPDA